MERDGLFEPKNKNLFNLPAVQRTSKKLNNNIVDVNNLQRKVPSEKKEENILDLIDEHMFRNFEGISREMRNLFDSFTNVFNSLIGEIPEMTAIRDIRISQTGDKVIIQAEITGLSMDDLDININEDYIRLSGKQKSSSEYRSLDNNSYRAEGYYNAFFRTIPLPIKVKHQQANVEYNGNILNISIPTK